MSAFKQYFRSHLKGNLRAIVCIFAAVLVLTFLLGMNSQRFERFNYESEEILYHYSSTLYIPVVFLCILAYVLPVMEFSFFKKRINLDCAYSLPISRRVMGAVHYLTGLSILFGAFTASYLLNFILLLRWEAGIFHFAPMIPHYFLCLLLGFAMYAFMVFVFNEGNTKSDGIWFMALYSCVFMLVVLAFAIITEKWDTLVLAAVPWGPIDWVTTNFQYLVERFNEFDSGYGSTAANIVWLIFWVIIGIAAALGFFLTFGKRRMEKTEELSDSYFGFRTLIPIYAICAMVAFRDADSILLSVIIELFAILGYTIYRRGFHYKKSDIAWLCVFLIFVFV